MHEKKGKNGGEKAIDIQRTPLTKVQENQSRVSETLEDSKGVMSRIGRNADEILRKELQ